MSITYQTEYETKHGTVTIDFIERGEYVCGTVYCDHVHVGWVGMTDCGGYCWRTKNGRSDGIGTYANARQAAYQILEALADG